MSICVGGGSKAPGNTINKENCRIILELFYFYNELSLLIPTIKAKDVFILYEIEIIEL